MPSQAGSIGSRGTRRLRPCSATVAVDGSKSRAGPATGTTVWSCSRMARRHEHLEWPFRLRPGGAAALDVALRLGARRLVEHRVAVISTASLAPHVVMARRTRDRRFLARWPAFARGEADLRALAGGEVVAERACLRPVPGQRNGIRRHPSRMTCASSIRQAPVGQPPRGYSRDPCRLGATG